MTKRYRPQSVPAKSSAASSNLHEQSTPKPSSPSSEESDVPADLKKLIERWVIKRFGIRGLVILAVVLFVCGIWWQWDAVVKAPGVGELVKWLNREKLPHGDPQRFSIAVAHLAYDPGHQNETLLYDALTNFLGTDSGLGSQNIEILKFDRLIELKASDAEVAKAKGHEEARRLLAEARADVLLWGEVLKGEKESRVRLFWTSNSATGQRKDTDLYSVQFELPKAFWANMFQWLELLIESQAAEFNKLEGRYSVVQLGPFIERSRRILTTNSWDTNTQAKVRVILAHALCVYGRQIGSAKPFEEAVVDCKEALKAYPRDLAPLDWAMTQNNLGDALDDLGRQKGDSAKFDAAIEAYQQALKEYTRDRVPLAWASTQNNLGNALYDLAYQTSDSAKFDAAIEAYQEALKEYTRDRVPLAWANTQNYLGRALYNLGYFKHDSTKLEAAIGAYQEALKEYTRDRVPLYWARTQNNLGNALYELGGQKGDSAKIEAAIEAYQEVLKERTRDRVPLAWASTQYNLGNALLYLARQNGHSTPLEAAIEAYQQALQEYTRDRLPLDWASTQNNLGNALYELGRQKGDSAKIQAAIEAYRQALKVWTGSDADIANGNLKLAQALLLKLKAGTPDTNQ